MYFDYQVKIPEGTSGVTRKTIKGVTYVYYVYERKYNAEKKYSVPKMTSIGKCAGTRSGMMYPNANYYRFFPDARMPKKKPNGRNARKEKSKKVTSTENGSRKRMSEQEIRSLLQAFEKSDRSFEEVIAFLRGEDG